MPAAVDWSNLTVAGAFVLGAVLATVATLRVVRSLTNLFSSVDRRRHDHDRGTDST